MQGHLRKDIRMPRIARKYLIGKVFHIMVQGLNKEYIFEKTSYKEKYKKLLKENIKKYNIKIIAYCIMNNHAHVLIYSENINRISKFMQRINTIYALYYNKIEKRVGYVFRDRFNIQVIDDEEHLKNCIVYIHQNPVKAYLINNIGDYKYSSYNEYIHMYDSDLVSKDIINSLFGIKDNEELKQIIYFMHIKNIFSNFIDVKEDIDYYKLIEYYRDFGLNDKEIIIRLKEECKLSIRKIERIMKITRYRINKILDNF